MTAPEVQYLLDSISDNYAGVTDIADVPLERIDRNNFINLDQGDRHRMSEQLDRTNLVGAGIGSLTPTPVGTDYNHNTDIVVGLRLEGAHHTEHGHIDPDGNNGVAWDTLKDKVHDAIMEDRLQPSVSNRPNRDYRHILELNVVDRSSEYLDYYRFDADYVFVAYETLP